MNSDKVEERLARKLASNDLPSRTKALKRLKKWIAARSTLENGFAELELLKLWKGLYVCMWHSDKPLVQEELAENIASLADVFHTPDLALDFIDAFFKTMAREWHGIDRLRLDKFYMLIRKVVNHSFNLLHNTGWKQSPVEKFISLIEAGPLNHDVSKTTLGIQLHLVEIYLLQLVSVVEGDGEAVNPPSQQLLHPFAQLLANTRDPSVMECICVNVMEPLLEGGEKMECIQFDADQFSASLRTFAISRGTVGRNRKTLYNYCKRFSECRAGEIAESAEEDAEEKYSKKSPPQTEVQLPHKKRKRRKKKQ